MQRLLRYARWDADAVRDDLRAYATARGRTLIERRLYLSEHSWCTDSERRQAAGIPDETEFATKPRLAWEVIAAASDAGVEALWVTGDEAYGQDPQLGTAQEARETRYVLAVVCSVRVRINSGRRSIRADTVGGRLPARGLAPAKRRPQREGPALLRLGLDSHRHRRTPPSADPP
nr:transposase [Streptomyces sp. CB01201]